MKPATLGRGATPSSACSTEEHGLGETHVHLKLCGAKQEQHHGPLPHLAGDGWAHAQVILSFLIIDHTKFSPDWCFWLLKQCLLRTKVACLSDLERVVNSSAEANVAQLVETQSGEVVVPTYSWTAMFAGGLRKLKHITLCISTRFCGFDVGVRLCERTHLPTGV